MKCFSLLYILLLSFSQLCAEETPRRPTLEFNRGTKSLLMQELKVIPASNTGDRALFRGTLWLLQFIDDDPHFQFVFTDTIRVLDTLSMQMPRRPKHRKGQHFYFLQSLAKRTLGHSLHRASEHLEYYFSKDSNGAFSFLELGTILSRPSVQEIAPSYTDFYQSYFPKKKHLFYDRSFFHALHVRNYSLLTNYIVDSSFPYHVQLQPTSSISPAEVHFENYVAALSKLPYSSPDDREAQIRMLKHNFVCQLVLSLSNFGRSSFQHTSHGNRLRSYLMREFPDIYYHHDDVRLLADVTRALLILGVTTHPYTELGIKKLLFLQQADGSWGSQEDIQTDPYEQFHMTTAALSTLALAARTGIQNGFRANSP